MCDDVDGLSEPGHGFVTLDFKFADGMVIILQKAGEKAERVRDRVNLRMQEMSRKGKVLKGRQIVWIVLESFKTFDGSDLMFGFDHLSNLHIQKHDLHGFIVKWNHILDNMGENAITKGNLRDVFYRKIQNEKDLHYDLNHYERMPEKERSYDWLMDRVNSVI